MGRNEINVLLNCDNNGEGVMPTLIKSICLNTERKVNVRILAKGWVQRNLKINTPKLSVEVIEVKDYFIKSQAGKYDVVNCRALYLASIKDWDRCLSLAWDQLVNANIDEYYDQDIEGDMVMTGLLTEAKIKQVKWGGINAKDVVKKEALEGNVFMGGSNIYDLKKIRSINLLADAKEQIVNCKYYDHIAFLSMFGGRVKPIDKEWNWLVDHHGENSDAKIIHYTGPKPWISYRDSIWVRNSCSWVDLLDLS